MPTENNTTVGDSSLITVGLVRTLFAGVIALFGLIIGAAAWGWSQDAKAETALLVQAQQAVDIAAIRQSMDVLALSVHDIQRELLDRWRQSDEIAVWAEFLRLNADTYPGLKAPRFGTIFDRDETDPRK